MSSKEGPKPRTAGTRIIVLLLLAVLTLVIIMNAESIRSSAFVASILGNEVEGEPTTSYSLTPDSSNMFVVYNDGLSVLGSAGLTVFDKTGNESIDLAASFSKPVVKVAGKYLIGYDVGGSRFLYVKDSKLVQNVMTDSPVLTAEVNARGWTLVVSEKIGSKATCLIYNDDRNLVYEWISSERYITCSALSDDCKTAVIGGLQQKEAGLVSALKFISFDSETPYAIVEFNDVIILDVEFLNDGSIAVLTEDSVTVFNDDGTERGSFSFESDQLLDYDIDGEDFLLLRLARGSSDEISDVHVLNHECKIEQSISYPNIMAIDAEENYFGILTSNMVVVYNSNLEKQFTTGILTGNKGLLIDEGGAAYVLSTVEATIYR